MCTYMCHFFSLFQTSHESDRQFLQCMDWTFNVTMSFTIRGEDRAARTHAGCYGDRALRSYIKLITQKPNTRLTLENINFNQVELTSTDISIEVINCEWHDSKIQVLALTTTIAIAPMMSQVEWFGLADCSNAVLPYMSPEWALNGGDSGA